MLIRIKKASDIAPREITPQAVYLARRRFLATLGGAALGSALPGGVARADDDSFVVSDGLTVKTTPGYHALGTDEHVTSPFAVFGYNNFAEYGPDKGDPAALSGDFKPQPWKIAVDGLCAKAGTLDLDDFLRPHAFEDRTYRLRCTETWSAVIPWTGISLAAVLKRFEPLGKAKFVRFETVLRPEEMPGQKTTALVWPYVEGLRLDEAMHPLAFLAVGMYGQVLQNQNGAPVRLVVPWKYGFKSVKSIVRISFAEVPPQTSWNLRVPNEYGFWANVNPKVDHARWSQASERRLGEFFRRPTQMFNGYEEEVASMYSGMDLVKNF